MSFSPTWVKEENCISKKMMLHVCPSFSFLISRFRGGNLHAGSLLGNAVEINHCGNLRTAQSRVYILMWSQPSTGNIQIFDLIVRAPSKIRPGC